MKDIKKILKRYLSGEADTRERQSTDAWYDSFETRDPVHLSQQQESEIQDAIWRKLQPQLTVRGRVFNLSVFQKIAAGIIVVIGAALCFALFNKPLDNKIADAGYTEFATGFGEKKQLTLSDSTIVILNSASHLRVYNDFNKVRHVQLTDGEAYFDVHHNPQLPFTIETGGLLTRVLGTAFNIKAYKKLNLIMVAVLRGKVQVSEKLRSLGILTPKQKLVYNKTSKKGKIVALDDETTAWQAGKLAFKDASFDEMALTLANNYNVKVVYNNPNILKKHFTASIPAALPAFKAAQVLASIHHLEIKQRRDTIIFQK
ncbi:FecR family protein [Mucilaginibacter pedocola]|uniref:FecR protein domain-containing protein n=1 Tax=Mucilaginibacter pedocola TaxID=1792845 RepID=A0A1S9PA34_9SPHI|nr:FecR domain-containing protein [Mucilaginibacter pedocola]OOQ57789.1 hypothetical protein BC343_13465 [Mucilaginibacter pedocola]